MVSRFDSPAKIVRGRVEACGPLNWAAGEQTAMVAVTITQKGEKVAGMAKSSGYGFTPGDQEWMLKVPSATNKKFKDGPAHAAGMVCVTNGAGDAAVFQWSEDIELEKP
ncbi:MAG TPA: hypothetical protein VHJ54_06940 [Solirubrobacterales bacterium]|jgi:hypothetical protein|nr:hypothetical protein [Solirubrobacterales bacterium]